MYWSTNAFFWDVVGWPMVLGAGLLIMLALMTRVGRRTVNRRLWCPQAGREVNVNFEEAGLPGYHRGMAVLSCSAFEPATDVQCWRSCLDSDVRRPIAGTGRR